MNILRGYTINFAAVPEKGLDGEEVYRSRYTITGPSEDLVESVQGDEHASKGDALDEAQVMSERRLSGLALYGVHHIYHQSWNAS